MPKTKLISVSGNKRFWKEVDIIPTDTGQLQMIFPYDEYLKDEVKIMHGARWNKDGGYWTVKDCRRNWFQIHYLMGKNPYAWYDRPLLEWEPRVKTLMPQQDQMGREAITYRQILWAAEMGLGKTLAAIMVMEWAKKHCGFDRWWWIGPKSALASFEIEAATWGMLVYPERVMTYDELVKVINAWEPGQPAPHGVVLDEFSRCKTLTTQRTQATMGLAEGMRQDHGDNEPFIIGMTGTPSPKSPLDWYAECEIIKPGFIREGNIHKFRDRLATVVKRENTTTGGVYPQILAWKDSEDRCEICGNHSSNHDFEVMSAGIEPHTWKRGTNEVARLYKRMKGLVSVYFKKDWLSHLPDKRYRVLRCKVSRSAENAARAVQASARSAIQALTMLRELSDGFLYQEETQGTLSCPLCLGSKKTMVPVIEDAPEGEFFPTETQDVKMVEVDCTECGGSGEVPRRVRTTESVASPKDTLLEEILDDHEDGRLVVYAGFTGSLDRVTDIVNRKGWHWIRVDGRGWHTDVPGHEGTPRAMLNTFQHDRDQVPKLCFIGHPGSAGMGLTLTASCETVFFSNDFNAESRIQAEDRIHRPGMDINKGAMITDLVHLPSDLLVLENLRKKKRLQDMTLGQFHESLKMADKERLS